MSGGSPDRLAKAGGETRSSSASALPSAPALDIERVKKRLEAGNGGYEIVHASPGLEVGVYVLVAPEPDDQQPHDDDELYYVLDGYGTLDIEGQPVSLEQGQAVFVPAGARHQFIGYEHASVLVVFARQWRLASSEPQRRTP